MTSSTQANQHSQAVARLGELSALVMRASRPWTALMVFAAVVSTAHLDISEKHSLSGSVGVTTLTTVLLALIWLPSLLRVLGVAGGRVKTPAGEATTPGLARLFDAVDPQTKRDTLPLVINALMSPGVLTDPDERDESRALRRDLESQLATVTPVVGGIRATMGRYAQRYDAIRQELEPGRDRTLQMTSLTAEVRAITRRMPPQTMDLQQMLQTGTDGERIIALAIAQDQPDRSLFNEICGAILESHSAFEQYHALVAAFEMLTVIDAGQQHVLANVLLRALEDPDRAISDDTSRATLIDGILASLNASDRDAVART